jgi:hypothetical protein
MHRHPNALFRGSNRAHPDDPPMPDWFLSFPCKYLGVPLSIYRLRKNDELPLIEAVATRIPYWKGGMLNLAGRATLTAVTLSAIPVHLSIAVCLSPWAIEAIDRRKRGFLTVLVLIDYIRIWGIILQDVQLQPDVSDRAGCCGGGLWLVFTRRHRPRLPGAVSGLAHSISWGPRSCGKPMHRLGSSISSGCCSTSDAGRTSGRRKRPDRSRCLCSQTLMPVLSALSTLKPSIDRLLVGCMHVVSLATLSRRILGTLGFAAMLQPHQPCFWTGPGGSLLGSRHVGASTNRLVGNAGWLEVVEGKKQLAERSENRRPRWLSFSALSWMKQGNGINCLDIGTCYMCVCAVNRASSFFCFLCPAVPVGNC